MEKYKMSTFMIDSLLNEYYVGLDMEYLGYECTILDNDARYDLSFNTYYHGKETLLILPLTKGAFARLVQDALIRVRGFEEPFVKITVRENAVGYSVEYQNNDYGRKRRR